MSECAHAVRLYLLFSRRAPSCLVARVHVHTRLRAGRAKCRERPRWKPLFRRQARPFRAAHEREFPGGGHELPVSVLKAIVRKDSYDWLVALTVTFSGHTLSVNRRRYA